MGEAKNESALRMDGYSNLLTHAGTRRDSTEHYQWTVGSIPNDRNLADLYIGNGLFATIIDTPATDAVSHGFSLGLKDSELQRAIDAKMEALNWQEAAEDALRWSRLFGGALIVMLVDDGRLLQEPLNWNDVRGVQELLVYSRAEATPYWKQGYENSPGNAMYRVGGTGRPDYYQIRSTYASYDVHASRCLVFVNGKVPDNAQAAVQYRSWGTPEYLRIRDELRNAGVASGDGVRLLDRCVQAVYKMKNLSRYTMTETGTEELLKRMDMIDLARSILNTIVIDSEGEDYEFRSLSMTGIKDIFENTCTMLSAVSHIPQTKLFGRSPAGMNATGTSDLENYYSFVGNIQSHVLRKNIHKLIDLVLRGMLYSGEIREIPRHSIEFKSCWDLSDAERATRAKTEADTQFVKMQTVGQMIASGIAEAAEVRRELAKDVPFNPENIIGPGDIEQDWGTEESQFYADGQQTAFEQYASLHTDEGDTGYVAGFVVIDGKILCAERTDGQGWCGPGGHIEAGETPAQAMRREAKEEFGITPGACTYLGNCKGKPNEVMPVQIFCIENYTGKIQPDENEMSAAKLFTLEQLCNGEVPGGKVFQPFRDSLLKYKNRLGLGITGGQTTIAKNVSNGLTANPSDGTLYTDESDFDESKHPRDKNGRFSGKSSLESASKKDVGKTKYAPSPRRSKKGVTVSHKKYAQLCGSVKTRYPDLTPEDGERTVRDASHIYHVSVDGHGGIIISRKIKIK